ncbi:MAG: hypothetical protein ACE14M_02750 [Terriglobales bacterium]
MAKITALIYVHAAQVQRLGRTLDSLRPCDQVLVINQDSNKEVESIGESHGAEVLAGIPGVSLGAYLVNARHDWLLAVSPCEELSQELQHAIEQWKQEGDHEDVVGFSVPISQQSENRWRSGPPETRLVNRNKVNWTGELPTASLKAPLLNGNLLRFQNHHQSQKNP